MFAQRFPSFQFDSEDVLNGKVKVFARAPSGRTQPMNVLDADGRFNANFVPDEVGTYTIKSQNNCDLGFHLGCRGQATKSDAIVSAESFHKDN